MWSRFDSWLRSDLQALTRRLDLEKSLFLFLLLVASVLVYLTFHQDLETSRNLSEARRFRGMAQRYLELAPLDEPDRKQQGGGNPLAYIEDKLKQRNLYRNNLGELTPAGKNSLGVQTYRLQLKAVSLHSGLRLLVSLEKEGRLLVREFSVERVDTKTRLFDIYFQLLEPYGTMREASA